ncbi:MAG: hypothetical protein L6R36_005291 [Xanthoria steineri]|nr:MAG: hypothetical protein L6R36_005291 [Xanthoria steineri]
MRRTPSSALTLFRPLLLLLLLCLLGIVALAQQNSTPPAAPVNNTLPPPSTFATSTFCRPNFYGVNLPVSSCLNAWAKIPRTGAEIVFGSRGQRGIDVSIPLRYQSDDGWCVVELRARVRATTVRADVATAVEVSDAVERVIEECVVRTSAGGSVTGFSGEDADARDAGPKGSNHLLTLTVAGFRSEARCVPVVARTPPPSPDACFQALQTVPLGYYKTQFMGARDTPTRSLYTRLPRWFAQGDNGQVQIEINDASVQIQNA